MGHCVPVPDFRISSRISGFVPDFPVPVIACGQMMAGLLIFAPNLWRRMGYAGAIVFLLAITGLGVGAAAPSNLILAGGVAWLLWESRDGAAEELCAR